MNHAWSAIPEAWVTKLAELPEFAKNVTVVDVTLKNGEKYENIVTFVSRTKERIVYGDTPFRWDDVEKLEVKPENIG